MRLSLDKKALHGKISILISFLSTLSMSYYFIVWNEHMRLEGKYFMEVWV